MQVEFPARSARVETEVAEFASHPDLVNPFTADVDTSPRSLLSGG